MEAQNHLNLDIETRKQEKAKKLRKLKIKRFLFRTLMYLTTTSVGVVGYAQNGLEKEGDNKNDASKGDLIASVVNSTNYLGNIDREAEINKRVEWIFCKHIENLETHLKKVENLKNNTAKKSSYVRNNFFKKAWPEGGYSSSRFYCMAAIFGSLNETADKYGGDLCDIISGHPTISCSQMANLRKDEQYKDYIQYSGNSKATKQALDSLKVGDVIMTRSGANTSSGWHARTFAGKDSDGDYIAISLNNEYIGKIKNSNGGYPKEMWSVRMNDLAVRTLDERTQGMSKLEFMGMMYTGRDDFGNEKDREQLEKVVKTNQVMMKMSRMQGIQKSTTM